jgi:LysR family transcriptional regulator, hydrogen peroxide-inducible genes activator
MEIHQLEYLVAVAEEGGFTRAAERLQVAQPSLSQQIKKLEKELRQPLFDRLPRGAVLTEAGQRMLEHARRILAELHDARRRVSEVGGQVTGTLAVGAIPTIAPFLLPTVVRSFVGSWPAVRVSVTEDVTARLLARVSQGELDLAVLSWAAEVPNVHVERVGAEPLYLAVSAGHRLAGRRRVVWQEVADEPLVLLHDEHCLAGQVQQYCVPHGLEPSVAARGAQLHTIAMMVSAGLGVSVLPEMFRVADAAADRAYVRFAAPAPERELCMAWSLLRYRTNAARAFAEAVRAEVARQEGNARVDKSV